jgi:hypothetical protein
LGGFAVIVQISYLGEDIMDPKTAYWQVRELLAPCDGTLTWKAGGFGGGGVWVLTLRGRTQIVPFRNEEINLLDKLFKPKVENPVVSGDYSEVLADDAFWLLIEMFNNKENV